MRTRMSAVLSFVLVSSCVLIHCQTLYAQVVPRSVILKAGTPVAVRLEETASSESCTVGQTIKFSVTRDVVVDDVVVIKSGTEARGEVSHAEATGSLGEEGALTIMLRETTAVNGERVPLRATLSEHGKEKKAEAIIFCPMIKGTKCVMESGMELKGYVDFDTRLTILEVE